MDIKELYKDTMNAVHTPKDLFQDIKTQSFKQKDITPMKKQKHKSLFLRYATGTAVFALIMTVVFHTNFIAYAAEELKSLWIELTKNSYRLTSVLTPKGLDVSDFTLADRNQEYEVYEKLFPTVSDIAKRYDVNLLQSDWAYEWEEPYTVLTACGEENNINSIRIFCPYYIMGDLPVERDAMKNPRFSDLVYDPLYGSEQEAFDFYKNYTYQTPIYYCAYIYESDEYSDYKSGGLYDVEGIKILTYTSDKNGVEAVIATYPFLSKANMEFDELNPVTSAHFIYDGIEYMLKGRVQPEQMKKIIDSLYIK